MTERFEIAIELSDKKTTLNDVLTLAYERAFNSLGKSLEYVFLDKIIIKRKSGSATMKLYIFEAQDKF